MKVTQYPLVGDRYTWGGGGTAFQVVAVDQTNHTAMVKIIWAPTSTNLGKVKMITFDRFIEQTEANNFTWCGNAAHQTRLTASQHSRLRSHAYSVADDLAQLIRDTPDDTYGLDELNDADSYLDTALDELAEFIEDDDVEDGVA